MLQSSIFKLCRNQNFFFHSIYIWLLLPFLDTVSSWLPKARRLSNMFKSKVTPPPQPSLCFSAAALKAGALCANLSLFPRKIHSWTRLSCLSHYGGESFSTRNWQAARPPNHTAQTRARCTGQGTAVYLHMYIIVQFFFSHTWAERSWRCDDNMRTRSGHVCEAWRVRDVLRSSVCLHVAPKALRAHDSIHWFSLWGRTSGGWIYSWHHTVRAVCVARMIHGQRTPQIPKTNRNSLCESELEEREEDKRVLFLDLQPGWLFPIFCEGSVRERRYSQPPPRHTWASHGRTDGPCRLQRVNSWPQTQLRIPPSAHAEESLWHGWRQKSGWLLYFHMHPAAVWKEPVFSCCFCLFPARQTTLQFFTIV